MNAIRLLSLLGTFVLLGADDSKARAQGPDEPDKVRVIKFLNDHQPTAQDAAVVKYPKSRRGKAGGPKAAPEGAQFMVSPAGESAVLLDTKTSQTWVLSRADDGEPVWLPASRVDSFGEAFNWRREQKILAEKRASERIMERRAAEERAREKQERITVEKFPAEKK